MNDAVFEKQSKLLKPNHALKNTVDYTKVRTAVKTNNSILVILLFCLLNSVLAATQQFSVTKLTLPYVFGSPERHSKL